MNIESLLNLSILPIGETITVEGMLMENAGRPYVGRLTGDWVNGRCVLLTQDGLFDRLLDLLFPNVVGGGNSLFLNPAAVIGRLDRNKQNGQLELTHLTSLCVMVAGNSITISFPVNDLSKKTT